MLALTGEGLMREAIMLKSGYCLLAHPSESSKTRERVPTGTDPVPDGYVLA